MKPEYADEIVFREVNLAPTDETALDLDFQDETTMWEWYGNIMASLGTATLLLAQEKPDKFRFPFLKVPFIYDFTEME